MAYVAISNDLIARVRNRIKSMRQAEVDSVLPQNNVVMMDASELYNRGAWGDHMHLISAIPKEWLAKPEDAQVVVEGGHTDHTGKDCIVKTTLIFKQCTAAYRRPSTDYWNQANATHHIAALRGLPPIPGRDELIARWEQACAAHDVVARWNKVESDILDFMRNCKSLNEALKLLPTLRMYIPKEDIQRVERKIERAPREALVVEIDTDGITAAAVAARLMGAAHGITGEQT